MTQYEETNAPLITCLHGTHPFGGCRTHDIERIVGILGQKAGGTVLDLGGGYGRVAIPLAQKGYSVTILENSRLKLHMAQLYLLDQPPKVQSKVNLVFSNMSRSIPLRGNLFDAIVCAHNGLNEVLDGLDRVFENIEKHLKPGGIAVLEVLSEGKYTRPRQLEFMDCFREDCGTEWLINTYTIPADQDPNRHELLILYEKLIDGRLMYQHMQSLHRKVWTENELKEQAQRVGLMIVDAIKDSFDGTKHTTYVFKKIY